MSRLHSLSLDRQSVEKSGGGTSIPRGRELLSIPRLFRNNQRHPRLEDGPLPSGARKYKDRSVPVSHLTCGGISAANPDLLETRRGARRRKAITRRGTERGDDHEITSLSCSDRFQLPRSPTVAFVPSGSHFTTSIPTAIQGIFTLRFDISTFFISSQSAPALLLFAFSSKISHKTSVIREHPRSDLIELVLVSAICIFPSLGAFRQGRRF